MLGQGFVNRYYELSSEKQSFLCVGLDPVTSKMRDKYVIPSKLIEYNGVIEGTKKFCLDVIKAVAPFTPIIKPNAQFILYTFSFQDLREIVEAIHDGGCLALLDIKFSDIGSTNSAGLHWITDAGFDAVTFNPFPGYENGSDAIYTWARERDKGIFSLCRMSNPGAHDYMSQTVGGEPLYLKLARDAAAHGCNGFVVGCTASTELGEIRSIIGEERLILSPGLGPQGGDPKTALECGSNGNGDGLIISSSRSINFAYESFGWDWVRFAEAAGAQALRKRDELNEIRRQLI
ncbi:MAG: orotidine-5'-phosphate decarboxylase [Candidatus Bathyarchaeota archaeon]|jgi:orotidine-5'-phosphate decarboxylase|nr:orotidine-5'-phosphate decarboxylase [Candidatus Bathyarchaeota archaeon]